MLRFLWKVITAKSTRWIAGASLSVLGIYGTFIYERKPDLSFQVLSSGSVLAIRESVSNLSIAYGGTDLRATSQNLDLLVLRVVNTGSADILKASFDDQAPLGFTINVGKIVEAPSVSADDYLKTHLHAAVSGDRTVTFSPVILNVGDSFEVRTLILVPDGQSLVLTPIGKIAGVRAVRVVPIDSDGKTRTYLQETFTGSPLVQAGRMFGYTVAFVLTAAALAVAIGMPWSLLSTYLGKRRRSRRVEQFKSGIARRLSLREEYLANQYIDDSPLFRLVLELVKPEAKGGKGAQQVYVEGPSGPIFVSEFPAKARDALYEELASNGLIIKDGPQVQLSPEFAEQAKEFVSFVTASEAVASARATPSA